MKLKRWQVALLTLVAPTAVLLAVVAYAFSLIAHTSDPATTALALKLGGVFLMALVALSTFAIATSFLLANRGDHRGRDTESRLKEILDHTTSTVYVKDLDGRYILANRRFQELWGELPPGDPVTTDQDLFPPETAFLLRQHDQEVLDALEPRQFDEVVPQGEGARHLISVKFPLMDSSGRPYAVCGISSDVADRSLNEKSAKPDLGTTVLGRILVVDDERAVREVASAIAAELGYDVLPAENGADGLRLFEEHRGTVDAVLLDLVMPVMSGNECFRAIRSLEPDTPIIVTSGFARGHDVSRLLEEPLTWFLRKPYRRRDLAEALARVHSCVE